MDSVKRMHTLFLFCLVGVGNSWAQDSILYTKGFIFRDGIYISFQDFKNNHPSLTAENFSMFNPGFTLKEEVISSAEKRRMKNINYPDSTGKIVNIDIDSVWGYCMKGKPYLSVYGASGFEVTPLNRYDYVLDGLDFFQIGTICYLFRKSTSLYHNSPFDYGTPGTAVAKRGEERQFLLNLDSGRFVKYTLQNFSDLLSQKDPELYMEFSGFSKKKKKEKMLYYLLKLNERNPVYFGSK